MPNVTLAIPEELHEKMKQHSEIRWSNVVRTIISEKISDLEIVDKIAKKSKLSGKDIEELSHKIKKETFEELDK